MMNSNDILNLSEEQTNDEATENNFQTVEPQTSVYVIFDKSDLGNAGEVEQRVLEAGCALLSSRDYLENKKINAVDAHTQYLTECDAVLIYQNKAPLNWVKENVADLRKIKPLRNGREFRASAVFRDGDAETKDALNLSAELSNLDDYSKLSDLLSRISCEEIEPYPGLRPFEYKENYLFFGREGKAQEIAERLELSRFVAVVGTSGSGKSSVVRAGLLPLLYGGMLPNLGSNWRIAIMRPEETPIRNLAESLVCPVNFEAPEETKKPKDETQIGIAEAVLRRSGVGLLDFVNNPVNAFTKDENLLIVVDQFEELFRFKEKFSADYQEEAAAFVKLLLEGTRDEKNHVEGLRDEKKRIFVIITMRSDFLGDCAQFHDLPEAINKGQYLIPQMTRDELRQSIESPALVGDAEVSPALVNRILNDLEDDQNQPGDSRDRTIRDQLPVLQHALMRTWNFWKENREHDEFINIEEYDEIGGMAQALSKHADEAFDQLSDENTEDKSLEPISAVNEKSKKLSRKQEIAVKIFKCLTETDSENREIRRPAKIEEICAVTCASKEEVSEVIDVFREKGRNFLMPPPQKVHLTEDTKIDISHESLIRNWKMLKGWVKAEAEDAWLYRRISEDAFLYYTEFEEDPGALWSGRALELALVWRENFVPTPAWASRYQRLNEEEKSELNNLRNISPLEEKTRREEIINRSFRNAMKFLDLSADAEAVEQAEKEKRLKLEAREKFNRILRWAVAGLLILLFATIGFAIFAFNKQAEVTSKNKELEQQGIILRENQKKLEDAQKELEKQNEDLNKSKKDLSSALEDTKDAKEKADEEAGKAKAAQAQALDAAKLAKAAEAKARTAANNEKNNSAQLAEYNVILGKTLDGTISAEANDYQDTIEQFLIVANSQPCKDAKNNSCRRTNMLNKWWAYHNIATANSQLGKFNEAKASFEEALEILNRYENGIVKNNDFLQLPQNYFLNVSYDEQPKNADAIVTKGRIITLRKFAQFYRTCAMSPQKCGKDNTLTGHSSAVPNDVEDDSIDLGEGVEEDEVEVPLSAEAIRLNREALEQYKELFKIERIRNAEGGNDDKDKRYKADVQKELADIYKDLKEFGSAKTNYEAARNYYESVAPKSLSNLLLMKSELEVTLHYVLQVPNLNEKNLAETEKLVNKILSKTEQLLPEKELSNKDEIFYNSSIGDIYGDLAKIYGKRGSFYKIYQNRVKELKKQYPNDESLAKIIASISGETEKPENLTQEQQLIYDELNADATLRNELNRKSDVLRNISTTIGLFHFKQSYYSKFDLLKMLASAYLANNENCKVLPRIMSKLEEEAKKDPVPTKDSQYNSDDSKNSKLVNLLETAYFYQNSIYDFNKAAEFYEAWAEAFRTRFPENSNPAEGMSYVSYYSNASEFYLARHKYPEARRMLTEYLTYLEKNEGNPKGNEGKFKGDAPLKRINLEILIAETYEREKVPNNVMRQHYEKALTDVRNWLNIYKPLEKPATTTVSSTPSNVNTANANVNTTNANDASKKPVASSYQEYSLSITLNKEASSYETYLRVRLADLDVKDKKVDAALVRLNEKPLITFDPKSSEIFDSFLFRGYVNSLRNVGLKTNAEQSARYFQSAIEALEYLKLRIKSYYDETDYMHLNMKDGYVSFTTLTKEFYDDYIDILEDLAKVKGESGELMKKIEQAEKERSNLLLVKDKEQILCKEPINKNGV